MTERPRPDATEVRPTDPDGHSGAEPVVDQGGPSPRWDEPTKIVAGVALGFALLVALYLSRDALTLIAMAGLIAFLVAPVITLLRRRLRLPRVLAVVVGYLVAAAFVALLGVLLVAGVTSSFAEVDPGEAVEALRDTAVDGLTAVRTVEVGRYTVDLRDVVDPTISQLEDVSPPEGGPSPTTLTIRQEQVELVLGGVLSSAQFVGGLLTALVVTSVVALYLSIDSHRLHAGLLGLAPDAYRRDVERVDARIGRIWRGFLYGQLLNSLATGLLVWLALWAIGLPGAFVLGLIMMVLNMIPTFGPIIAAVPGVLAAIALGSTRLDWGTISFTLLVVGVYVVMVQLQANLMGPFITGQAVRMSPAAVLIGLIVGFQVGGLVGAVLAVPVIATLREGARYVLAKLVDRDPFPDREEADPPEQDAPPAAPASSTTSPSTPVDAAR